MPNRKVLVVDDVSLFLDGTPHALQERFEIRTVHSAHEALFLCRSEGPFAVALTDQDTPGMNGIDFLRELKKGWPDTTRIMVTGSADLGLALNALHEAAIFRFLQKPLAFCELLSALEAGVERFHRIEEERLLTEQLQFSRESLLTLAETLEQRLADQLGRLQGLKHFALRLNESHSPEEVAEVAAQTAARLLGSRAATVTLLIGPGDEQVKKSCGGNAGEKVHLEPIRALQGEIGCLQLDVDRALSDNDRLMLTSIASQTAIAASAQIHRRARELAHHATIFALARLTENRDDETGKHLERVSAYCRLIAEGLRDDGFHTDVITPAFVEDLVLSAPLHDIGKVGIPDSILLKPGPLSESEWEVMRRHPTIGAETLRHLLDTSGEQSFLRMGHEIAWCHHERWDGSGYPRGLRGEEIPLAARIMSLADCYDALTTWRPYKRPWSHEEALTYVREQCGKHFDPCIADAFLNRTAEADEIRSRLADSHEDVLKHRVA